MRHAVVAFAALFLLAFGALAAFDRAPELPAVSKLMAAPGAVAAHSGKLEPGADLASIMPPERFQGDGAGIVIFGHADVVARLCRDEGTAPGEQVPLACVRSDGKQAFLIAANPCIAARTDLYAAILCHELGHLNGWPAQHGD